MSYDNDTNAAQQQKCTYSRSVKKSSTWSTSTNTESTINMSVKAGIPTLVEVSGGFSVTQGVQQTSALSTEETITESDEVNVVVPARKSVRVELSVGRATIDLAYSATVEITCVNGSQLVFPSTGTYHGVAYTAVNVKTRSL